MSDLEPESRIMQVLTAPIRLLGAVLTWLGTASESFERILQEAASRTFGLGDATEKANNFFERLQLVLLPFFWLWNDVLSPVSRLLLNNPISRRIGSLTYWLWYPLFAVASFGHSFIQTRGRGVVVWSIPFLIVIGGVIFALWFLNLDNRSVTYKYRVAINEAIAKGEFQQAALYQQKLQTLGILTDQTEIQRIRDLAKAGRMHEAIEMAERITPDDRPGSPDIHFWLAGIYFEGHGPLKAEESLDKAIYHLTRLEQALRMLDLKGAAIPANVVLLKAMIEFRKSNVKEGLDLLQSISGEFWPARILQMEIHIKLGQDEAAMQDAIALSHAVKREPALLDEVSAEFFSMWCVTLQKTDEREQLKTAVSLWHQRFPQDPHGLTFWAGLQLEEVDALMIRGGAAELKRANRILIDVTSQLTGRDQQTFTNWLLERLPPTGKNLGYLQLSDMAANDPDINSLLLAVLGTAATIRGDHKLSLDLLKRATAKDSKNVVAWNNLAFVAHSYFEEEFELAQEAVNRAAKIEPNNIEILHTRGFIRLKLEQWDLAIEDLRAVVAERPNAEDVHQGLAEAYNAIGKTDLAEFHRQLATN
jgi:tetratricopeptide (TPR) repeat protein